MKTFIIVLTLALLIIVGCRCKDGWGETNTVVIASHLIQEGETLGKIASLYNTTWQDLMLLNPQIKDENIIYAGEKLVIAVIHKKPLTREQRIDRLANFMFKKAVLKYQTKNEIECEIGNQLVIMYHKPYEDLFAKRKASLVYITLTRQLEIWQLAEAMIDLAQDNEELVKLIALAWQESHFVNRIGKCGEVSWYQFLPSTIQRHFSLDDIGLVSMLYNLRNSPRISTEAALTLLRDYKWNWAIWNHGPEYGNCVTQKSMAVKRELQIW